MIAEWKGRWAQFFIGFFFTCGLLAQEVTETNWYFGGTSENLVFDLNGRDSYLGMDQLGTLGLGGPSVITDQFTGNMLFYSDGINVYDAGHNLLTNALSGNSSINTAVVSAPVTGSPGQYYFFSNAYNLVANDIEYTVVDATLVGNGTSAFPTGDLVSINTPTGLTNPSEGMIIIPSGDGELFWLITQDRTTFQYRVTPLDAGGIGLTTNYDFTGSAVGMEVSHFSYNADSLLLAATPKTANRNVRLLQFDPSTGILGFDRELLNTGFDDGQGESVYDAEWSNDGSKIYISRYGSGATDGDVYQYDLADPTLPLTSVLTSSIYRSYGLQRGLDGRIYHLHQLTSSSGYSIGRIDYPDSLVALVEYSEIVYGDNFNARQFPNFSAAYNFTFTTLDFSYFDDCQNAGTKFFPQVDPVPQEYLWDFSGGSVSNRVAPILNFSTPGSYTVSLTANIGGVSQTVFKNINIFPNNTTVDLGNDTTICVDEILILDAGTEGIEYQWSTGSQNQTIAIDTAGTYWVEVTGADGCTAYDEIEVTEYGVLTTVNNQWYFGEQAGIDFTNGATAITDENLMDSPEGCASISDINGDLLFYTNGSTVWNKEHQVMMDGDSIGGDSVAIQSATIMPFSDDQTLFYIFTSEQVYSDDGVFRNKVSIVDIKEDSARGAVVEKGILLNNYGTEKIISSSVTGIGWLLTHEMGNNIYRANLVNDLGIGETIYSPAGEVYDITDEVQGGGALKFSNGAQYIGAVLPRTGGSFLEILDFDGGTGAVSNARLIDMQETDPAYGLEFSQDGSKLYVSTNSGTASKLIQYDLDSINSENPVTDIAATKYDGYATGPGYGTLQMGPDGTIYMAVDNSSTIGTISSPSGDDDGASFDPAGFDLLTRTSRLGLPNFSQEESSNASEPAIVINVGCFGQESSFSGVGRDDSIEEYFWNFGDGSFASGQDTTHVYAAAGTYTVQLTLSNRCDVDTVLYEDIVISAFPETPQVPLDTVICDISVTLSAWPVDRDGYTYTWSTGETTREIAITEPSIVSVFITDPNGCQSEEVFSFVRDGRPEVDIGANVVYCLGDAPPDLDASNPGASYEWQVDGTPVGNSMTQSINTSVAGTFEYSVAVTDPLTFCVGRDTVEITVLALPDVTITPTPTLGCGADDGSIQIDFNVSGNYDYDIQGPTPLGPINIDGPATVNHDLMFAPGNYTVEITNTVSGCVYTEVVQVEDPTMLMAVSSTGDCEGDVELTITNLPANYDYDIWLDGQSIITGTDTVDPLIVSGQDPGTYSIEVSEIGGAGCVETEEEVVVAGNEPDFTFDAMQSICGTSGNIFVVDLSGSATYTWSGPSIVGTNTGVSVEVDAAGTYQVTASQTGLCDRTEDIEVTINPEPSVVTEMAGNPCDGEIELTALVTGGTGPFTYLWNSGEQVEQFTTFTSGQYSVTVRDQATNCEVVSAAIDVVVEELLEVSISATPDCEDNGRIILDAISSLDTVTYAWSGPNGPLSGTSSQITVSVEGTYTVEVTNNSGTCVVTESFDAILTPITDDDLLLDETANFCSLDASNPGVDLNPGVFNTYEWTRVPDPTIISTAPVLTVTEAGTYEVTLYNGFTCTTDRVIVRDDCIPVIFAPTAFTPNGDGLNDAFSVIPNPNVQDFKIVIANRWGEPVFTSEDINFEWDGTLEGKLLTQGTYSYRMTFSSTVDSSVGVQDQYGAVVLVR